MNRLFLTACFFLLFCFAAGAEKASETSQFDAMLKILPKHKESHVRRFKSESGMESPFRKGSSDERPVEKSAAETSNVAARILAMLPADAIGGVMVGNSKAAAVVINNEVYSLNEEIRLSDGKGGTRSLVDGYQVVVRSVSKREIVLEGLVRGAASISAPVRVTVQLDEFFH